MVAHPSRRSPRGSRHALRSFRAAPKSRPHHRGRRAGNQLQAGRNSALSRPRHRRISRPPRRRRRAAGLRHAIARDLPQRTRRKISSARTHRPRRRSPASRSPHRRPARRIPRRPQSRAGVRITPSRDRITPRGKNPSDGTHQSPRLFLVITLPQLRRLRAMPELQHRPHLSQKSPASRMPLLRILAAPVEAMPEMPRRIHVFRRRRRRARRRISARNFPHRENRAPGPRHCPHQARIPASPRRIRQGRSGRSRRHANGRQRPRFSARHPRRSRSRRSRSGSSRFPRRRTHVPEHYAIQYAAKQDYLSFYEKEAHFRRMLHYPPFTALAGILVRDKEIENAIRWSRALATYFAPYENRGVKILGPAAAPLARLRQEYRFEFLLKSPKRSALSQALSGALDVCAIKEMAATAVIVDVDPASLF